jgi:hypothetical protein
LIQKYDINLKTYIMKRVLFLFLLVGMVCGVHAQQRTVYCEMIGSGSFTGKSIKISFDFGSQGFYYKASDDNQIVNEKGKVISFSSMIAALNYMAERGWELHTAYSASVKGQGGAETYRYILTKNIGPNESIMEGIKLLGEYKQKRKAEKMIDDIYK